MTTRTTTVFNETVQLLKKLDDEQLTAVYTIVSGLSAKEDAWVSPLDIHTEEQLISHIDHSLEQAKAKKGRDADEVIDDLIQEYSL